MKKVIPAGWDPGRLNNKLYLENDKVLSMNAICSGYQRRVLEQEEGPLVNFLDVELYQEEDFMGRYFVGAMAYKFNRGDLRWSTSGLPKFHSIDSGNDEIVKLMTYLALSQVSIGNEKKEIFCLGTGVPTEEYFEQPELLADFEEALKYEYKVVFKHPKFCNSIVKIRIKSVYFKPEGTSAIISMCYSDDFKKKPFIDSYLEKGPIIGMNIGSSTTDVSIMNSKMEFEPQGFFGLPIGSSNPLNEVRNLLYKSYNYDVPKVKLDHLIRTYNLVKYKGHTIDLKQLSNKPYKNLVSLLKSQFYDKVEQAGILLGESGALFISGGTCLRLQDELHSFIPGVQTVISADPLFEDARGYFIEAKYHLDNEESIQSDIFKDNDIEGV